MGGKGSKQIGEHGTMFLQLNTIDNDAGSILSGTLHLDIKKPYQSKMIVLRFEGAEKTEWTVKKKVGKTHIKKKQKGKK